MGGSAQRAWMRTLDDERDGAAAGSAARGALRGAAFLVDSVSPKSFSSTRWFLRMLALRCCSYLRGE